VRALLLIAAGLFAFKWTYGRVRLFVAAFLLGTLVVEGYLWLGGRDTDPTYHKLCFWAMFCYIGMACWLGYRQKPWVPTGFASVALGAVAFAHAPNQLLILQAVWLSIPAWQLAGTTLGNLFAAQAVLYLLYSLGENYNPLLWHWLGDWVPAIVAIAGMVRLECPVEPNPT